MSASPARLVLHVGQHKTGSKALQSFCAANAAVLAGAGVAYPVAPALRGEPLAYARSHFRLFEAIRREALGLSAGPGESAGELLARFEADRRRAGAACLLLSAEDLFDMATAHDSAYSEPLVEAAARALAAHAAVLGFDARVVVYLRRQDHLLAAHYAQFIKGSGSHDLGIEEFTRAFAPRLDARKILGAWERALGRERILVRRYEPARLAGGIVADFFEHALRLAVPASCTIPDDVEALNRTPSRDVIEYIRGLNRAAKLGRPVPARKAVLEAARHFPGGDEGVAAWLSPAERRALLERHAAGNASIAEAFLPPGHGPLFLEPPPADDRAWTPYPGLTPKAARAIERAVEAAASRS